MMNFNRHTTVYIDAGVMNNVNTRTAYEEDGEPRYVAHQIWLDHENHVTVYINRNSKVLSLDVGTNTEAKVRVGGSRQIQVNKHTIERLLDTQSEQP